MKTLLALLVLPVAAHAQSFFQIQAGVGITHYATENGRWYQNGMPENKVTSITPALSLGVTGALVSRGAWGIDWHAGYANLGRAAASCWCTINDQDYQQHRPSALTEHYTGSGNVQGVALTLEPYRYYGGLRFGIEAGAYLYRSGWKETVTNSPIGLPDVSINESRWSVAPVAGASVGNGVWSVSYRHYLLRYKSQTPPLWNGADVLMITRRF